MHRGQRARHLFQLIQSGEGGRRAVRRIARREDFESGPNSVAPDGRADATLGIYMIPSQYRNASAVGVRRSRRLRGQAPPAIADPPYKVTMRDNIATSCNGPDHQFRGVRCKHMIVAEKLFRVPIRRSQRRLRPATRA